MRHAAWVLAISGFVFVVAENAGFGVSGGAAPANDERTPSATLAVTLTLKNVIALRHGELGVVNGVSP